MEFLIHDNGYYHIFSEIEAKGYAQTCKKDLTCEVQEDGIFLERLKLLDIFNKRENRHRCTFDEMKEIFAYYLTAKDKNLKRMGKCLGYSSHSITEAISKGLGNGWSKSFFEKFMMENRGYYFLDKKANKEVAKWEIFNTFKGKELEDVYTGDQVRYERREK